MGDSALKTRSVWTLPVVVTLSLAIGFWSPDVSYPASGYVAREGKRMLSEQSFNQRIALSLEHAGIGNQHPEFAEVVKYLQHSVMEQWRSMAKFSEILETFGLSPSATIVRAYLVKQDKTFTGEKLKRLAQRNGQSERQLIQEIQDNWSQYAFDRLLRDSEIDDAYSLRVHQALFKQTRDYTRFQTIISQPEISSDAIKQYFDDHQDSLFILPKVQLQFIKLTPEAFKPEAKRELAETFFEKRPHLKPDAIIHYLQFTREAEGAWGQKQIDALKLNKPAQDKITALLAGGWYIHSSEEKWSETGWSGGADNPRYFYQEQPSQEAIIQHYQNLSAKEAFEASLKSLKELAYTEPESLQSLAEHFKTPVETLEVQTPHWPSEWPKEEAEKALQDEEVRLKHFNSPVLTSKEPAYIVFRVNEFTDKHPAKLEEMKDNIRKILEKTAYDKQKKFDSFALLRHLGEHKPLDTFTGKVKTTDMSIAFDKLNQFAAVEPMLNSFLLYATKKNPMPTFMVGDNIMRLKAIHYPELPAETDEINAPSYLSSAIPLVRIIVPR